MAQAAGPAGTAAAGSLMAVDAAQAAAPVARPDSLASLLGLLASTYGMHPGGWVALCWAGADSRQWQSGGAACLRW